MTFRWAIACSLVVASIAGCVTGGNTPNKASPPPSASPAARMLMTAMLPALYQGDLPCADCVAIRYSLDLRADRVFFLRMTYLGKGTSEGESFDDIGVWSATPDAQAIILRGGREAPLMFAIENPETLRKLDEQGQPIDSTLNYELRRNASYRPLEPKVPMRGMYRYMADAAVFRECTTQLRLPVSPGAESAALERAYLGVRKEPGEELLVSLEGQIAMRPPMEGSGEQPALVIESLTKVWSGASCATPQ